jgi:hypothetical protein
MKTKSLLLLSAALLSFAAARAEEPFVAAARERGIAVVSHTVPTEFAIGDFSVSLRIRNEGDLALRGSFDVFTVDAEGRNPREYGKAQIDMPPKSVSADAEQELAVSGRVTAAELGRKVRILLRPANVPEIVCYEGPVVESRKAAERRASEAAKATGSAGGRHEIRWADRLPEGEGERYRAFLEAGGVLIVRLVECKEDFAGAAAFCGADAMPEFRPQKGAANSYDINVEPGDTPFFDWPNRISETLKAGNGRLSLPGEAGKRWETVQKGYTMLHRVGKGMLIISTHEVADTPALREDVKRQLELEEGGFRLVSFAQEFADLETWRGQVRWPALGGGKIVLRVKNANYATTNLNLAMRLDVRETRKGGRTRTWLARTKENAKIGETFQIEMPVPPLDLNGEIAWKTEVFEWGGKRAWTLAEGTAKLPEFFEVVPPAYRGQVSTRRRRADVAAGVRFARRGLDAGGGSWKIVAKDAKGKAVVAEAEGVFAPGAAEAEAWLPVPADAPAGEYRLEAEATLPDGSRHAASGAFRIVAPVKGQIMADQDGFLLNEGEPYFPLGIYHCHTFNWDQPIDDTGLRARDMGFNWMQMWEWDYRHHLSLDRTTLGEFVDKKLAGAEREAAIDALLESNKVNRAAFAGVAICFEGFGVWNQVIFRRPGESGKYDFETDERIRREIASISEDPDQLVRMWYFSDEAGGNFHRPLKRAAEYYASIDKAGYPAFNLGNLAAVMAGDVGGNDIYLRYYGGLGSAAQFADRVDGMRREYAPLHRRPFIVPQAFGQSEKQSTETPAWVRVEAYLACIGGANGIGFYCWTQTGDWNGSQKQGMGWNPATAHAVKRLIEEIKVFQGALMSGAETRLLSEDGNVRALLCGDDASGRYLICANTLEFPVKTELAVPGLSKLTLEPLFGAPKPDRSGDSLRLSLPVWGTAVWRVK